MDTLLNLEALRRHVIFGLDLGTYSGYGGGADGEPACDSPRCVVGWVGAVSGHRPEARDRLSEALVQAAPAWAIERGADLVAGRECAGGPLGRLVEGAAFALAEASGTPLRRGVLDAIFLEERSLDPDETAVIVQWIDLAIDAETLRLQHERPVGIFHMVAEQQSVHA